LTQLDENGHDSASGFGLDPTSNGFLLRRGGPIEVVDQLIMKSKLILRKDLIHEDPALLLAN
jgi:hypothetical protein